MIGALACVFLLMVVYTTITPNLETLIPEHRLSDPAKTVQVDKSVRQKVMPSANTHNESSDSKNIQLPAVVSSPVQRESKSTAFKQYADAEPLAEIESPFVIQWLNDSEASRMPVNDLLSKAKVQFRESIQLHPIKNRQEAANQLNVNVSFTDFPSKAFESADHFFFSAPLTQDFRRGFVINKKTGEISIW